MANQHLRGGVSRFRWRSRGYRRRPPRTLQGIIRMARQVHDSGGTLFVATDFDSTVSREENGGDNPFLTTFDAAAGDALRSLQAQEQIVGIISNRAALPIVDRCRQMGFARQPYVVGTYGYEVLNADGEAAIDERFAPYRNVISDVLRHVRVGALRAYGLPTDHYRDVQSTIPTPNGPIFLEIKGQTDEYLEGIAQEYNLNMIAFHERPGAVALLDDLFRTASSGHPAGNSVELTRLWGRESEGDPHAPGHYSWVLRPHLIRAKAYGLTQLLRTCGSEGPSGLRAELLVYVGDHKQQDGQVMWAGKVLERLTRGGLRFAGVWAYPGFDTPGVRDESDLQVPGVPGVARLLKDLAQATA
jgi:hypothetical protein